MDIREEDKAYVLHAELPSVAEQDLKVSIDDNVLPGDADHEAVGATFTDGLLTLHVPRNQASKAREIPIKAG